LDTFIFALIHILKGPIHCQKQNGFILIVPCFHFQAHSYYFGANTNVMKNRTLTIIAALFMLSSCYTIKFPGDHEPSSHPGNKTGKAKKNNSEKTYPFSALGIPRGHLPPPGQCKIWYPGKPPGHQPAPQSCVSALKNAPPGTWVITHEGGKYKVNIFNRTRKGIIDEVKYYLEKD
jgi:hypothetical protein